VLLSYSPIAPEQIHFLFVAVLLINNDEILIN